MVTGLVISLGCIKVQTGHSTEERKEYSSDRAAALTADMARRLRQADPVGKVEILIRETRFVSGRYQEFARQFADEWEEAETGRGRSVEATEMRKMIGLWTESETPILKAWDENLEMALREARLTRVFDGDLIRSAEQVLQDHYDLYSAVMFPSSNIDEYRAGLDDALRALETSITALEAELGRYR